MENIIGNLFRDRARRHAEAEERILYVVSAALRMPGGAEHLDLRDIAMQAGLPHSLVYKHYKSVESIYRDNLDKMLRLTDSVTDTGRMRKDDTRTFLMDYLTAISRNRVRFSIEHGRHSIAYWLWALPGMRDLLTQDWTSYGAGLDNRIFLRYCTEFVGIMFEWGESGYSARMIEHFHARLCHLTETAPWRELELVR